MKARLTLRKNGSPGFRIPKREQKENLVENAAKASSNTFFSTAKEQIPKAVQPAVKMVFGRKARSSSPKENASVKLSEMLRRISKRHSPAGNSNSQGENSRNRKNAELSISKSQNMTLKRSPVAIKRSSKLISLQKTRNSPKFQSIKTEAPKGPKHVVRAKHNFNEELWEAAEAGDVAKISQLLEPRCTNPYFNEDKHRPSKELSSADINSTGIENRTALHCAVYENKAEAVKALVKYGAALDVCTIHRRTPLHIACILGQDAICGVLLDAGAMVNVQDFEKNTPAHYASYHRIRLFTHRKREDTEVVVGEESGFDGEEQQGTDSN